MSKQCGCGLDHTTKWAPYEEWLRRHHHQERVARVEAAAPKQRPSSI